MKITYIAFVFLFASCITQQKCAERFPQKEIDSSSIDTVYIHDTSYITRTGKQQTFEFQGPTEITGNTVFHEEAKKGTTTAIVDIQKGKIKVTCKEDAYKDTIAALRKQITKSQKKTVIPPPVIKYIEPRAYRPLLYYFGITSLLAIGFAAGKWFKIF